MLVSAKYQHESAIGLHTSGASRVAQLVKNLPAMWIGKIPWRSAWQSIPVFLPGESHGQTSLVGNSPWGHRELDTTAVASQGSKTRLNKQALGTEAENKPDPHRPSLPCVLAVNKPQVLPSSVTCLPSHRTGRRCLPSSPAPSARPTRPHPAPGTLA